MPAHHFTGLRRRRPVLHVEHAAEPDMIYEPPSWGRGLLGSFLVGLAVAVVTVVVTTVVFSQASGLDVPPWLIGMVFAVPAGAVGFFVSLSLWRLNTADDAHLAGGLRGGLVATFLVCPAVAFCFQQHAPGRVEFVGALFGLMALPALLLAGALCVLIGSGFGVVNPVGQAGRLVWSIGLVLSLGVGAMIVAHAMG